VIAIHTPAAIPVSSSSTTDSSSATASASSSCEKAGIPESVNDRTVKYTAIFLNIYLPSAVVFRLNTNLNPIFNIIQSFIIINTNLKGHQFPGFSLQKP
jgi:hypothetical protein